MTKALLIATGLLLALPAAAQDLVEDAATVTLGDQSLVGTDHEPLWTPSPVVQGDFEPDWEPPQGGYNPNFTVTTPTDLTIGSGTIGDGK